MTSYYKKFSTLRVLLFLIFLVGFTSVAYAAEDNQGRFESKLAALEKRNHGRIGVYAINTANDFIVSYRGDERFPLTSTSKVMVVGAILSKNTIESLNRNLNYTAAEVRISGYAPVTGKNLSHGMSIKNLCAAAIQYSDNAAFNLLIKTRGGPKAVNQFARTIGDNYFRLDRLEPALNTAIPGDKRDTTTPAAMAISLRKLVLGKILSIKQREWLQQWLKENTTGNDRIRAGVPNGSVVGDKTGTGSYGATNDIAIIWQKEGRPTVLTVYFVQFDKNAKSNPDVVAQATRIVFDALHR